MTRLTDMFYMLRRFIDSPRSIGALVPSSPALVQKIVAPLRGQTHRYLVELGAGTGVMTRALLELQPRPDRVLVFETDTASSALLIKRFAGDKCLEILNEDARNLGIILQARRIESVDAIICSLPFASLGQVASEAILRAAADALSAEGLFVAFQYTTLLRPLFERFFDIEKVHFVMLNVPPAFVYVCRKQRTVPL